MPNLIIRPSGPLRGSTAVPGDKSITHRAIILASLAEGDTRVQGWVPAEVCLATLRCMTALGAEISEQAGSQKPGFLGGELLIRGHGLHGLREPADVLHCAGSGTTIRLLAGLLAGQPFTSVLTGTEPLRRRPMGRVAEPLRLMGATVLGRDGGRLPPLAIHGGNLRGIDHRLPVASAQVKSALLLAGLYATGETIVHEPGPSRDHTERMLAEFEVEVKVEAEGQGAAVHLTGGQRLVGGKTLKIPGDFSSAAFLLVAATIVPGSDVHLIGVGVNPTRTGLYDLLTIMGARVQRGREVEQRAPSERERASSEEEVASSEEEIASSKEVASSDATKLPSTGEPLADLTIRHSPLHATEAAGDLIVRTIDEFPIFAVAATQAEGITVVREAEELRVKESDRIASITAELRKMGADITERHDGMIVRGPTQLHGAVVECHRDHRLAMALAVAGLVADGTTVVRGAEAINDSFPGFVETMQALGADISWSE
ncbi:MAG: 3-phosphoshikimate 1-carboxyvinyltransferase [Anaerolineae bacterium]